MVKFVVKRNGSFQSFDSSKINNAMKGAFNEVRQKDYDSDLALAMSKVMNALEAVQEERIGIESIQDLAEDALLETDKEVGKAFIRYRENHARRRNPFHELMATISKIEEETNKDNANMLQSPASVMYQIASEASKTHTLAYILPQEQADAHRRGDIHIHDLDYFEKTVNCLQLPIGKLLKNGFNPGHGRINPPKHIGSLYALIAIAIQSSQNDMFGGQSIPSFDTAVAPYIEDAIAKNGMDATLKELRQASQGLVYNLNSMHSRAGNQIPFSSLNVGLDTSEGGRLAVKYLLEAYDEGLGNGENPIFPNILFKVRKGVSRFPGDPNYDLFRLAMKVAAHRMNPTFVFMDTSFNSPYKSVDYMGCRTRVISNVNGEETSEARGNIAFVTINLPRLALFAAKGMDKEKESAAIMERFFSLLDKQIRLCEDNLLFRYRYVCDHLTVRHMPFVMGQHLYMGSESLKPDDSIESALKNGTLSVGFIGLAETLVALTGKHHGESEEAQNLGLQIVAHMRKRMDEATAETHLNFSLFATPAEGLAGRFTKMDKKIFGEIPGVTDREYYTNSVHIPAYFKISHYKKMALEGRYHKYLNAGHIAYVEFQAPPINNLVALEKELNHMADSDIGYAGINFPIDYCGACGYQGVIDEDECPVCGKHDIHRIRRVTGYLSEVQNMNTAKKAEVHDRTATLG